LARVPRATAGGQQVIEVEGLRKRYGTAVAVADLSFTVAAGEIFGLLGPNGAGKTTTIECLLGLRRSDGGHLRVLGLDPQRDVATLRRRVGCQLQESALPDRLRVWEALELFAALAPGRSDWRRLLSEWGLAAKRDAAFATLSGGERQRLFVALALVNDPEIVFLDELTQGLDPGARRTAWELIRAVRERGTTVVLVTHFMDEAERLCDRVAVLVDGRAAALDTPQGLVSRFGGSTALTFTFEPADIEWLGGLPHVHKVSRQSRLVRVEGTGAVVTVVAAELARRGIFPSDLRVEHATLEDVYLTLTGGAS
jgi:ABC-2 type transport system ATP-binding protein